MERRMAAQWSEYVRRHIPVVTKVSEREALERAFYAGARAFALESMPLHDPAIEPTARDYALVEAIDREVRQFQSRGLKVTV